MKQINDLIFEEVENNRDFKKSDTVLLPIGFHYKVMTVLEDKEGLYCIDSVGYSDKRYIYKTVFNNWDTSLILEKGFRKIKIHNEKT